MELEETRMIIFLNILFTLLAFLGVLFAFGDVQLDRRRSGSYIATVSILALALINLF